MEQQLLLKIVGGLIAAGGLGFMNYAILDRLNVTDMYSDNKLIITLYIMWWTLIDCLIYDLVHIGIVQLFSGTASVLLSIIFTVLVAFVVTIVFAFPLNNVINRLLSFILRRNGFALVDKGNVWTQLMGSDNETIAYLYDFNHNPLGWGYVKMASSDERSNYSLDLQPFNQKSVPQDSYDEITKRIQEEGFRRKYSVDQLIDFKQRFIVIAMQKLH